jgi:hypothetical protein
MFLLHIFMCEDCVEEHLRNTQSVSCYCKCHSSSVDEKEFINRYQIVMKALAEERRT